jgi:hypothetical protein
MESFRAIRCYAATNSAARSKRSVGSNGHRALTILRCSELPSQPSLSGKELNMERLARVLSSRTALIFGRSFFPLFAIVVILGAALWGPWVSLGATVVAIAVALRSL